MSREVKKGNEAPVTTVQRPCRTVMTVEKGKTSRDPIGKRSEPHTADLARFFPSFSDAISTTDGVRDREYGKNDLVGIPMDTHKM